MFLKATLFFSWPRKKIAHVYGIILLGLFPRRNMFRSSRSRVPAAQVVPSVALAGPVVPPAEEGTVPKQS